MLRASFTYHEGMVRQLRLIFFFYVNILVR